MIPQSLLTLVSSPSPTSDQVVKMLDRASRYWLNGDRDVSDDAEAIIRLLARRDELELILPGAHLVLDALSREAGLYPYLDGKLSTRDYLAREVHSVPGMSGFFFHSEQMRVFSRLKEGRNVVLSAPTSFGKTLLVDALIAAKKPKLIIIVVPTISLLEERRRTLSNRFKNYQIITQSFQELSNDKAIILGTQERILERDENLKPDLFVIDEFYKLDLTSNDMRAKSLNLLLAKYIDVAGQVYMLGPSIEANPINQTARSNFEFIRTEYSPVASDVIVVDPPGTNPDTLVDLLSKISDTSSLIYCRSPKSSRDLAKFLINSDNTKGSARLGALADWLRQNYHPHWYVADALSKGIGIHHGRIPRAVSQLMVQLFNRGEIKHLICTSSLIEGVNTAAENVIIYDKYISTRKLDRFTFDNIKGRAGRMFQHFIGRVFLFNEAPSPLYETLDIPLLQDREALSDSAVLQIPDDRLSDKNLLRKRQIFERVGVPAHILQKYAKFGVQEIESIFIELEELLASGDRTLLWSGIGRYKEVLSSMEIMWGRVSFEKHGIRSPRQFALFVNKLQRSKNIREFLESIATGDVDDEIDLGLNFLKGAEYAFLDPLKLLEEMIAELNDSGAKADYSKFLSDLASWGLPGHCRALEEIGVPAPLTQKLSAWINVYDFDEACAGLRSLMESGKHLTEVERDLLELTIN